MEPRLGRYPMVPEGMAANLWALDQPCYFVHKVAATVSYGRKLLDIRTEITHLELDKYFFFNESDSKDILLLGEQAPIPSFA